MQTKRLNPLRKRVLSTILAVAMILSLLPISAFAGSDPYADLPKNSAQQIASKTGNPLYVDGDNVEHGTPKQTILGPDGTELYIDMSKSIAPTANENEFEITLEVVTNSVVSNAARSDAAVVIVLDVSGSMLKNGSGSSFTLKNYNDRRLTKAVNAINEFIDEFADVTDMAGNPIPGERWVSVVAFGSADNVRVLRDWKNVGREYDTDGITLKNPNAAAAKLNYENKGNNQVGVLTGDGTTGVMLSTGQMTSISSGLSLALAQLGKLNALTNPVTTRDITSVNTILFTDGEPNENDGSGNPPSGPSYSTESAYNSRPYRWAEYRAYQVRATKSNLFTVAYGSTSHTTWLGKYIASNTAYNHAVEDDPNGGLDLSQMFTVINNQISMLANAWTVTDPMGDYMELVDTTAVANTEKGISVSPATAEDPETISWDLRKDTPNIGSAPGVSTYKLTYLVRLKTAEIAETYWSGNTSKDLPTNGTTTLTYTFEQAVTGGTNKLLGSGTKNFLIPRVHGYRTGFAFDKVGPNNEALEGFKFLLGSHSTTSESDGTVAFSKIPSGHTYVLSEENYIPDAYEGTYLTSTEKYDVVVSYGKAFLFEKGTVGTPSATPRYLAGTHGFTFVNPFNAGSLTIKKADVGGDAAAAATIGLDEEFDVSVTFAGSDEALGKIATPTGFTKSVDSYTYTGKISINSPAEFTSVPVGVTYTVTETGLGADYAAPTYNDNATATSASGTIASGNNIVTIGNIKFMDADFTVTKSIPGEKDFYSPGDTIQFSIVVKNTGGYAITNLDIVDTLNGKTELAIKRVIPGVGTETWDNANGNIVIAPGAEVAFIVDYTVTGDEPEESTNKVDVKVTYSNDEEGTDFDTEKFKVVKPNVTITKTAGTLDQPTGTGYETTYTVVVKNTGDAVAHDVVVDDTMTPAGVKANAQLKGKITVTGASAVEAEDFPITIGTLNPEESVTITYVMEFAPNTWKAEDLPGEEQKAAVNAWVQAQGEYDAAKAAYEGAIKDYEAAVTAAETDTNTIDLKTAMETAESLVTPLEDAYKIAQAEVEKLYAEQEDEVTRFEQAMAQYFEDFAKFEDPTDETVTSAPVMPDGKDFIKDHEAAIAVAEAARNDAESKYTAAVNTYNDARKAYEDAVTVDPEEFYLGTLEAEFKKAASAFDALEDLEFEFDLDIPYDHTYTNTAKVTYNWVKNMVGTQHGAEATKTVDIEPTLIPALVIDKQVSVDGGKTWGRVASFKDADGGFAEFKMTIKNIGLAEITGIAWEDYFDDTQVTSYVTNVDDFTGTLGVNETYTFTWNVALANTSYDSAVSKTNVFSVKYEIDGEEDTKTASATVIVPAKTAPVIEIIKEVKVGSNPDEWAKTSNVVSDEAQNFTFRFTLTNTGTADATVSLEDTFKYMGFDRTTSAYVAIGDGAIALGEKATVEVPAGEKRVIEVTLEGVKPGEYIVNTVTATYIGKDGETEVKKSEAIVSVTPQPKAYLSVVKKVVVATEDGAQGPIREVLKDEHTFISNEPMKLVYKITINNSGSVDGTVKFEDIFGSTTLTGTLTNNQGHEIDTNVPITVPALGKVDMYFIVEKAGPGTYKNTAIIESGDPKNVIVDGEDDAEIIVRRVGTAHLTLDKDVRLAGTQNAFTKTLSQRVASRNSTVNVEFRITVKNDGDIAVIISEGALVDEMVSAGGASAMDYLNEDDLQALAAAVIELDAGASKSFIVHATIPVGTFVNTAKLSLDGANTHREEDEIGNEEDWLKSSATVSVFVGGGTFPDPDPTIPDPTIPDPVDPDPVDPDEIIPDEELPTTSFEPSEEVEEVVEEEVITEEDLPLGAFPPQTGDNANILLLASLFGLAAIGFVATLFKKRKPEHN